MRAATRASRSLLGTLPGTLPPRWRGQATAVWAARRSSGLLAPGVGVEDSRVVEGLLR